MNMPVMFVIIGLLINFVSSSEGGKGVWQSNFNLPTHHQNLLAEQAFSLADDGFKIYWNAQSQRCGKKYGYDVDVSKYGIIQNSGDDGWRGDRITIFAKKTLGFYPQVLHNGTILNGGIPQAVNLTHHLQKAQQVIESEIPNKTFSGPAIIDWEAWRPTWERNWDQKKIYQTLSIDLVTSQHPTWSRDRIVAVAKQQFESSAREMMLKTVELGQKLRPLASWGFYHFSECFKFVYQSGQLPSCSSADERRNDKILWLFQQLTGTYPSGYFHSISSNFTHNYDYMYGQIVEQQRLLAESDNKRSLVFPYGRFRYGDVPFEKFHESFFRTRDMISTVSLPAIMGTDGLILWDDHYLENDRASCEDTKSYLDTLLGPLAASVIKSANRCAKNHCAGKRCFYPSNRATKAAFDRLISKVTWEITDLEFLGPGKQSEVVEDYLNGFNLLKLMESELSPPRCIGLI